MRWVFIFALFSGKLLAEEPPAFDHSVAFWGALGWNSLNDSPLNPGNQLAQVPDEIGTFEIRPDLKLIGEDWRLTARPRLIVTDEHTEISGEAATNKASVLGRWTDGFGTWNATRSITVTYGLQNFQWGPAEAASPSNRIFRDPVQIKDILYVEKGEHLLRLNWTPNTNWSEVLIYELSSNGDPEYEYGEAFDRKALSKTEYSWAGGADYLGMVVGWRDRSGTWLGEYANLQVTDGLTLYADVSHQSGSLAYYPVPTANGAILLTQSQRSSERLYTFAVSGIRYTFENGNDVRLESIYEEAGYSSADIAAAATTITSTQIQQLQYFTTNASIAQRPGLEFPGRNYLFASARSPDSFGIRNWNLYLRYLQSLQDSSNTSFLSSENAVGDHGTLMAGAGVTSGHLVSELRGLVDVAATLAFKETW